MVLGAEGNLVMFSFTRLMGFLPSCSKAQNITPTLVNPFNAELYKSIRKIITRA